MPMLKGDELIGGISMYRQEVRPFTDKQIELVQSFAAQAVIAIENARLLNELRESLEQQTATSEVLKVISSSQGDLDPVFQAMLENAVRICDASFGMLFRVKDELVSAAAMVGVPPQFAEFWRRGPQRPGPRTALGRVVEEKQTVHIADVRAEAAYVEGEPVFVAAVNLGGFRTILTVPMLKDNELIGAVWDLSPGSAALSADKEDRIAVEFRRPGRDRHREHAAAQRAARIPYSSRPPRRTCSRSSAARLLISKPCWTHWPSRPSRLCEADPVG